MMIKFICYPKCTTCQKAKKWLDDNGVEYWHGEPIESKEATIEEQEEIGRILESFREKEEI